MGTGTAPLLATYPQGFPSVVVAGQAVSLSLFVPTDHDRGQDPKGLARHRARVAGSGEKAFVQTYDPQENKDWRAYIAGHVRRQILETEVDGMGDDQFTIPFKARRVIMNLRFNFHKPVSYPARVTQHTKKPDIDNLAKAVLDALVNEAKVLGDDNMITDLNCQKRYAVLGHPQGIEIEMTLLPCEVT